MHARDSSPTNETRKLAKSQDPLSRVELFTHDNHLRPLAEIEEDIIKLAIGHYRGRMSEVARHLAIGRSTLYRKLSEMNVDSQK